MSSLAPVSSNERLAHADDGASAAHPPTPDVVTLGEPMIELASGRTIEDQYTFGWGGDVSNFAVAAARLGAQPAIITRVGDDPFGQSLQSLWTREGVDTRFVEIAERQPTGLYVMTRDAAGRHAFQYYRRGSAASYLGPADIPESIATARTVHVSGISMAISDSAREATFRALRLASEANVPITLDPNVRERLWSIELARAVIGHALAFADVAFPSLEDGAALAGREDPEAIVDWMLSRGTRMVVLKLGAEGCLVATRTSSQLVPGAEVKAVDTAGAGDTFAAAFVTATLEGHNAIDSARFANAAAALTTTGLGCVRPIPRRNAVERLLAATPSTGQDGQPPLHTHRGCAHEQVDRRSVPGPRSRFDQRCSRPPRDRIRRWIMKSSRSFRKKLVGPAVTVSEEQADGAGAPTHALEAIDHAAPGSVMVIGVGGERNVAVWGGLMTAGAHARGLAGAVLDGGARDIEEIERDYEFAVYARSVSPNTTVGRFRTIASDVPVVCGGVTVCPGDWIVGDADGVVVVPAELAEAVATEAEEIEAVERAQTEAIKTAGSLVAAVETYRRI